MASARRRTLYLLLALVSLLGIYDVAQFLATNTGMFTDARGRALGSVLGLILWAGLLAGALAATGGWSSRNQRWVVLWLAWLLALGNLALTAIHAAAHAGGLRPAAGGVLGLIALALVLVVERRRGTTG